MLLILIPIGWLAVAAILTAACRLAARADAGMAVRGDAAPLDERAPVLAVPGLTVWDCEDTPRLRSVANALTATRGDLRPALPARRPHGRPVRRSQTRLARGHAMRSTTRS
ncbi:MAG: hypothetical protein JWL67_1386 [Solirubrobacterales bacterium]|jgi:hypothetical protein|nr:hypothetical protein [Solirubrobacterales bacterium]